VDVQLLDAVLERDWASFSAQCARLRLGPPRRAGSRIDVPVTPTGTTDPYVAVLLCDDYDARAPLLDFANPTNPAELGALWWPNMATAPYNTITYQGRQIPILCTPGTLGYHLHPSHYAETHQRTIWRLPKVATLIARLVHHWGPYQGRGR
jgi:hypothetical protein